jgi:hypothetical protein
MRICRADRRLSLASRFREFNEVGIRSLSSHSHEAGIYIRTR